MPFYLLILYSWMELFRFQKIHQSFNQRMSSIHAGPFRSIKTILFRKASVPSVSNSHLLYSSWQMIGSFHQYRLMRNSVLNFIIFDLISPQSQLDSTQFFRSIKFICRPVTNIFQSWNLGYVADAKNQWTCSWVNCSFIKHYITWTWIIWNRNSF